MDGDEEDYFKGTNISLWLEISESSKVFSLVEKLQIAGSTIISKPQETPWNATYAKIQDPFGVIWELNAEHEEVK